MFRKLGMLYQNTAPVFHLISRYYSYTVRVKVSIIDFSECVDILIPSQENSKPITRTKQDEEDIKEVLGKVSYDGHVRRFSSA